MTSLISSLNTISNEALLPTVNGSSPNTLSSSHVDMVIRVLSSWVNTRLGKQSIEHFDTDFRDGKCLNNLMSRLQQDQIQTTTHIENNGSTHQDHLSDVARIIDALMENDNTTNTNRQQLSTIDELEYSIRTGHVGVTLELVSCIILRLSMKYILVDQHVATWIKKSYPYALQTPVSTLPTFQIGDLTFHHTYLKVRSTLLAWVNWQFKNGFGDLEFDPILDFGPSWKNGLAFTLLVHCQNNAYLPGDVRQWVHQITQLGNNHNMWTFIDDRSNARTLLSLVFDIACRQMDIPTYFVPQDLLDLDTVNEWCVIIYVYGFYQYALSSQSQHQQQLTTAQSNLQQALLSVQSISHTINDDGIMEPLHPLDNIDDNTIDLYSQTVSRARSLWENCLSENKDSAQDTHQQLEKSMDAMNQAYDLFNLGVSFSTISQAIQTELQVVETMMNNTDATMTTDSIQQLESRMSMVQSSLSGMEEEFGILLKQDRYSNHLNQVHERYKLVCAWVDQVRIWMIEADRIRGRIGYWIDLIRERNSLVDDLQLNALAVVDLVALDNLDVMALYNEHEQLKREVDRFEADDMKRLRAHVKQRTTDQDLQKDDLTPADTSTIEITLITLNMLHLLLQLMTDRGFWIDCLVHRLKWEHLFAKAVEWVFAKDNELDEFFRDQALWCEQNDDGFDSSITTGMVQATGSSTTAAATSGKETAEEIIGILMRLEQDIAAFDRESFTDVLEAYQEMERLVTDSGDDTLPNFLEQRQTGFEAAFEDLMKRCGLGRKAVEQHLVMMDITAQFKNIKNNGELLRRRLLAGNDGFGDNGIDGKMGLINNGDNAGDGLDGIDDNYNGNPIDTSVRNFKETSADFLSHAKTRVPYPDVPMMLTAMGAQDSQNIGTTNDAIRSALHTYGMSLALIADGLDQLLAERQHMHSLQRRVKHACEQLVRFADWMTDKRRMIDKSDFDLYDNDNDQDEFAAFTFRFVQDKDEQLVRLEKERDGIASRTQQMECDELAKLLDAVNVLESDIDAANAVFVDRHSLVNALQSLEDARNDLNSTLLDRAHKLDVLKKHLEWKTQWIKSHQWILSTTRKLWDFCVKKARFDPAADNVDNSSAPDQRNLTMALHSHQDRISDAGERQMTVLLESYQSMMDGMNEWAKTSDTTNSIHEARHNNVDPLAHTNQLVYDFTNKQSIVVQEYRALIQLSQYASKLVAQRSSVVDILVHIHDASREGERLRDNLTKSTRRMMEHEPGQHRSNSQSTQQTLQQQQQQSIQERVEQFQQLIVKIKKNVDSTGYHIFSARIGDTGFSSIFSSTQTQQSHQSDIKNLLLNKMNQLLKLESLLVNLLASYNNAEKKKQLVLRYSADALELDHWIQEQIATLKNRHLDVAAESLDVLLDGKSWDDLGRQHQQFVLMVESFETDRLRQLHDKVAVFMDDTLATKNHASPDQPEHLRQQHHRRSVDMTLSVTQNLAVTITNFAALKQEIIDEAVTMDAVRKRIEWSSVLEKTLSQLELIQTRLSDWCKKKDQWIYSDGFFGDGDDGDVDHGPMLLALYQDLEQLTLDKDEFTRTTLPVVHELYDTFVQSFANLPRPAATPDHIENAMASLDRSSNRCHEALVSRNKELDVIQGCIQWETDWKGVSQVIKDCQMDLEHFVVNSARWKPLVHDQDMITLSKNSQSIHQQWAFLDQKLQDLTNRFTKLQGDVSTNNVGNVITKSMSNKLDQVDCHFRHVIELNHFMDLVIKQNGMVQDLLCRINHIGGDLKQVLEGYKAGQHNTHETYNSSTDYGKPSHISIQHNQFTKDVGQLRSDASGMIYPVRPAWNRLDGGTPTDNDDLIALDNAANKKIRDTLTDGISRLDQNVLELGRIILVNEKRSRCYATLQAFKKQLEFGGDFIKEQRTKLQQATTTLETDLLNTYTATSPLLSLDCYLSILDRTLSSANEIDRCLKLNNYVLVGIQDLHEQYLGLPHDELDTKVQDEFRGLHLLHNKTVDDWQELRSKTTGTTSRIETEILPSLLTHGLKQLNQELESVDTELRSQHYSIISEDQLAERIKKTRALRQNFNLLRTGICGGYTTLSVARLDDANNNIGRLEDLLKATENRMAQWRQIEQRQCQINVFVDKATTVIQSQLEIKSSIDALDFTDRMIDSTCIMQQHKQSSRQVMEGIQELENLYEDLHNSTQLTGNDEFQAARHQLQKDQIEETWTKLQDTNALLAQRMNLMNRWLELYGDLKEVRQTVIGCKTTLETLLLGIKNQSSNHYGNGAAKNQSVLLDKVDQQMHMVTPKLKNGPETLDQALLDDKYHYGLLSDYYQETLGLSNVVEKLLQEYKFITDVARLTQRYQDAIEQRQNICIKQKLALEHYDQQYEQLNLQYRADGYPESKCINIPDMLKSHFYALDYTKGVVSDSKNDIQLDTGDINGLYEQLTATFNQPRGKMDQLRQPLLSLLDNLTNTITRQELWHQFIGSVETYDSNATELLGTIMQLQTRLASLVDVDNDIYTELTQQHSNLKENMDLFMPFDSKMVLTDGGDLLQKSCLDWLRLRNRDVLQTWAKCCDTLAIHQQKLLDDQQTQQENSKLEDLIKRIDDMKKRVDTLHLSGCQNIESEHQELDDIEKEFLDSLCPCIDIMLDNQEQRSLHCNDNCDGDDTIQQLYASLNQSKENLKQCIRRKKVDASQQDKTLQLVNDINELERLIDLVDESVAAAAPHHSRIVNGSFVKLDLQDLLNNLIKTYKVHSLTVGSSLENLQGTCEKVSTSTSVLDLLETAKRRWTKTKEAAAARERELQMCIEQLQNDFFTKLAIIGKTQQQQKRHSTLSMELSSPSSSTFSYKVDRENSLDVQIGQLLKSQPYRTKVKMVPGQVGKYWIGDKNPRLVYCRILKSKMVMVRVGGGWVELSQFLLDHGCNEGTIIPGGQQNDTSRFKEAFMRVSSRSLSPSNRVTLRGGGGIKHGGIKGSDSIGSLSPSRSSSKTSTSTRCRSPLAGYTDGERYVRVDESGNHFALKMTRVDDDYFIPYQNTNKSN
ncbi:hypothetical protein BC941DRAFT_128836 [Chlamydoabsidia padenii]|nr:hypothetical protein BC941DRAFT_128836 [Chlamydoabsidia padenii]